MRSDVATSANGSRFLVLDFGTWGTLCPHRHLNVPRPEPLSNDQLGLLARHAMD
jgi:hypothetical protein